MQGPTFSAWPPWPLSTTRQPLPHKNLPAARSASPSKNSSRAAWMPSPSLPPMTKPSSTTSLQPRLSDSIAKKLANIESLFAKNPTTSTLTSGSTNDARIVVHLKAAIKGKWAVGRFCSSHGYGVSADHTSASCKNKKPAPAATVSDAAGKQHCSSAQAEILLDLPDRTAKIMPSFQHNLMGIGKLCDNNCRVVFDKTTVTVFANNGSILLQGWREQHGAKLWRFSLIPNQQVCPTEHHKPPWLSIVGALVHYLHAVAGFPVKATWLAAIKASNYASWPGLTHADASKYCPSCDKTIKGHLTQVRQGIRSTKPKPPKNTAPTIPSLIPPAASKELHLWDEPISKLFTDNMGRFPVRSRSCNQYLMLAYHCDTNTPSSSNPSNPNTTDTASQPRSNSWVDSQHAPTQLTTRFWTTKPRRVITEDWNCSYELVPPNVHRRNIAKQAIQTFKVHFLSILAGLHSAFPNYLWDMLIPQTELTLNLLRQSHTAPAISAWEAYNNAPSTSMPHPSAPAAVPSSSTTNPTNACPGLFVGAKGSALAQLSNTTAASKLVVIWDTVEFRHDYLAAPTISYEDRLLHAINFLSSYPKELGRLCQDFRGTNPTRKPVNGTNTFHVIIFSDIPPDRLKEVCYSNVVCKVHPEKADPDRTRITIAGNRICYPGDRPLQTRHQVLHLLDISNFYLQTPLDRPEYIKIKITDIPQTFINKYYLFHHVHNDWVYFEIRQGIYGLPQSGILAQQILAERLAKKGYYQCQCTPGLW
eukprot:CCRYP_021176-RA/>CCRYP_021176-RA protein AED:0.48 eAED:0.43 QI:0/0/0/0.85/0/0/7/0/757